MTNEERFKKYVEMNCKNCKNKDTDLCNIKITQINNIVKTFCEFYKKESKVEGYKDQIKMNITARKGKPIMKGIDR